MLKMVLYTFLKPFTGIFMAIQRNDLLAKILNDTSINSRRDTFLWFYLVSSGFSLNPSEFRVRDRMAAILNFHPELVSEIPSVVRRAMLSDEYLTWIKNDERQHKWLTRQLQSLVLNFKNFAPNLLGRELVIAMIDVWDVDINTKALTIRNIEAAWVQHKQNDQVFKWFHDKDEVQRCALAWDWLCKNKPPIAGITPISNYGELLMLSDLTQWSAIEKTHCLEACRKRWSQQQYRENLKGKKQCNFVLSEKIIRQLDALAETYDLKRPQILEVLIKMETEMKIYLPEKMKRLGI